ncbi:MAG: hypothetical protein ABSD75_14305 [Terriglobales bacterium]|jgi:hypothetical protein
MKSPQLTWTFTQLVTVGIACMSLAVALDAQVKTESTTTHGRATKTISVDRGQVVYASGRDLVLQKEDGTVVHFANVSDGAIVDGKHLAIDDLKPGMKLERTITTVTTPHTIRTVQSVTGKVWHVNPPSFVILTLEDGTNHQFNLPADHKVTVDGRVVDAWHLKKGMKISATKVVEVPGAVVTQETNLTGNAPTAVPANEPVFFALLMPAPASPAVAEATPAELPETGSPFPVIGLAGVLALGTFVGLRGIRVTG